MQTALSLSSDFALLFVHSLEHNFISESLISIQFSYTALTSNHTGVFWRVSRRSHLLLRFMIYPLASFRLAHAQCSLTMLLFLDSMYHPITLACVCVSVCHSCQRLNKSLVLFCQRQLHSHQTFDHLFAKAQGMCVYV